MQTPLHRLEDHLLRGATECARVLGVSYSNYAAMKAGSRPVPTYVVHHVEALIVLPLDVLHAIVKQRLANREGEKR